MPPLCPANQLIGRLTAGGEAWYSYEAVASQRSCFIYYLKASISKLAIMPSDITKAIQHLCAEKDLSYEVVLEAVEAALAAAFRKDFGNRQQNVKVAFDPETGDMKIWDEKETVEDIPAEELERTQEDLAARREAARSEGRELTEEETTDLIRFNPKTQIMISEARAIKNDGAIGDILKIPLEIPAEFGRMAAQTAKQVIIQKLREAERAGVFEDFKKQEGHMVSGIIQRRDRGGAVIVDLGKITGIAPTSEQNPRDAYRPGARMRFYALSVSLGMRGPEIILSRAVNAMVESIFREEIPEVGNGTVEIKAIARDVGNRSKVAVFSADEGIDPIGSCIGQRGSRITTIIAELGGEKIDIIQWSPKPEEFVKYALSPAKAARVELNYDAKDANAFVAPDQFSLAIGRGGQNVRLAAALTGWKIRVVQEGGDGPAITSDDTAETIAEALPPPAEAAPPSEPANNSSEDVK